MTKRLAWLATAWISSLHAAPDPTVGSGVIASQIDERMEHFVEAKEIAGAVTLVADDDATPQQPSNFSSSATAPSAQRSAGNTETTAGT